MAHLSHLVIETLAVVVVLAVPHLLIYHSHLMVEQAAQGYHHHTQVHPLSTLAVVAAVVVEILLEQVVLVVQV
jgi:hypothetical protein